MTLLKPEIFLSPESRTKYILQLLKMDGLSGLQEDPLAAYCAVSLTNTPKIAKAFVAARQETLKYILTAAGISSYDPGTAPGSPDLGLTIGPDEIYKTDISRVASARFFTVFDTFPSTGVGVEIEAARRYNRIPVIFHDEAIRTSRMQPDCTIHLNIADLQKQTDRVVEMFKLLKEYEPGRGLYDNRPVLLGFKNLEVVVLTHLISAEFPDLVYTFDGTKPALLFGLENHDVLTRTPDEV
jgi:hypothetical protein